MANDIQPLVNGIRHSWSSVRLNIFGRTVTGIASINYGEDYKFEDHKGAGGVVVHRTVEFDKATFDTEMFDYEFDAIMAAMHSQGKTLADMAPVDVPVVKKPKGSDGLVTDIIHNANITGYSKSYKNGDGKLVTKVKWIASNITLNIQ